MRKRRFVKEEAQKNAEKKKPGKGKLLAGILFLILAAGLLGYLVLFLFLPMRDYKRAEALREEHQYDEAASGFASLSREYDLSGVLARLGGFSDAAERVPATRYEKAEYLREQGSYEEALQEFEALGDYRDSKEQQSNTKLVMAKEWIGQDDFESAISLLESLGDYDGGDFGSAGELLDKAYYTRAEKLESIGKLSDAEAGFAQTKAYQDSYEKLQEVRYNIARNALLVYDFDTAKEYFEKVGDYKDAKDLLAVLDTAVDRVYRSSYMDQNGKSTDTVVSYLWVHSVIVPGRLDEGVSVKMQESYCVGELNPAWFGAASTDYSLEQVRDANTWYFTYYGSETENANGALLLEAKFSDDYSKLTTRKVYQSTRDEEEKRDAENAAKEQEAVAETEDDGADQDLNQSEEGDADPKKENEKKSTSKDKEAAAADAAKKEEALPEPESAPRRSWTLVGDSDRLEEIKEGFRSRRRVQLAENGNMAFNNATDDARLSHYCSVANCLNKGTMAASDENGRRYYCSEHEKEYEEDPAYEP